MFIVSYLKKSTTRLKKVTKISKVSHVLKKSRQARNAFRKYIIYYGIALVLASAERSFSVMRKIKAWLRSTVTDNSVNNRMFSNIHKNLLDNVNLQTVADDFAKASETLINYLKRFFVAQNFKIT